MAEAVEAEEGEAEEKRERRREEEKLRLKFVDGERKEQAWSFAEAR
ncbi:hypothetical protein TRV_04431 [Trichophyton verrucosum HKI 0517]|uniref:Uncharacterized protein n=1 Tax=Trichophyton verrucosum (strain HKI 0517) TaxID=663202 RepID=D4DBD2_TRIVH|nr:uncharacterized protein TRV_04431 [Trichophyton verrucosum HKI 0517]EFE40840.1 hypothetical protein TRV_04431 [Trichophyton verrucosum HKI 0517]